MGFYIVSKVFAAVGGIVQLYQMLNASVRTSSESRIIGGVLNFWTVLRIALRNITSSVKRFSHRVLKRNLY